MKIPFTKMKDIRAPKGTSMGDVVVIIPKHGPMTLLTAIDQVKDGKFLKELSEAGWDYVWIWRYVIAHLMALGVEFDRYGVSRASLTGVLWSIISSGSGT